MLGRTLERSVFLGFPAVNFCLKHRQLSLFHSIIVVYVLIFMLFCAAKVQFLYNKTKVNLFKMQIRISRYRARKD
jgi:hypothetical protein